MALTWVEARQSGVQGVGVDEILRNCWALVLGGIFWGVFFADLNIKRKELGTERERNEVGH